MIRRDQVENSFCHLKIRQMKSFVTQLYRDRKLEQLKISRQDEGFLELAAQKGKKKVNKNSK